MNRVIFNITDKLWTNCCHFSTQDTNWQAYVFIQKLPVQFCSDQYFSSISAPEADGTASEIRGLETYRWHISVYKSVKIGWLRTK